MTEPGNLPQMFKPRDSGTSGYTTANELIEAVQWTGDNLDELYDIFTAANIYGPVPEDPHLYLRMFANISGRDTWAVVPLDWWIARRVGDNSDLWTMGTDYQAKVYKPMESSLPDPDPDDNHTPSRLDSWELELTGVLKAYDDDGNEIFPGVRPTPELVDKLTDRLMDHWYHIGHYHWYHHLAHRLNVPLWVHRLIHCRKCEHDISGSTKLTTGEVSLTVWFDHKDDDD